MDEQNNLHNGQAGQPEEAAPTKVIPVDLEKEMKKSFLDYS